LEKEIDIVDPVEIRALSTEMPIDPNVPRLSLIEHMLKMKLKENEMKKCKGKIKLILGPMFSGKIDENR